MQWWLYIITTIVVLWGNLKLQKKLISQPLKTTQQIDL